MEGPRDYHTKWSKPERRTNTIWHHLCVESKIRHKWTYLQNRNRLTDIENRLVVAKGEGGGGGMDWEFGVSRCKLVYMEWINNRSYCIAQGTIFNIPWQTIMEKNMKKSIYMSHFAVQQRLIQHCKSTILQLKKNVRLLSALSLSCRWEVIVDIPVMWECFIMIMNLFCTNSIHIWLSGEIFFFLNFKRPIG